MKKVLVLCMFLLLVGIASLFIDWGLLSPSGCRSVLEQGGNVSIQSEGIYVNTPLSVREVRALHKYRKAYNCAIIYNFYEYE